MEQVADDLAGRGCSTLVADIYPSTVAFYGPMGWYSPGCGAAGLQDGLGLAASWLYEGGRFNRPDVDRGLGKRLQPGSPLAPVFWLAFSDGAAGDNPALAISAGNEAELVGLDDKEIAVKNDTCSAFYIWFYAQP